MAPAHQVDHNALAAAMPPAPGPQLAATLRARAPVVMHPAAKFLDALGRVRYCKLPSGLFLLATERAPILRLWQCDT